MRCIDPIKEITALRCKSRTLEGTWPLVKAVASLAGAGGGNLLKQELPLNRMPAQEGSQSVTPGKAHTRVRACMCIKYVLAVTVVP